MSDIDRRSFIGTAAGTMTAAGALAMAAGRTVNVGCIGVGNRGSRLLSRLLKIEGVRVRALCDTHPEHLKKALAMVVQAGQPEPEGYDDCGRLLARSDIEAVVSALPVDLHATNYLAVLAARKDLYAEKPLASRLRDCDKVVEAVQRGDSLVQVGFQRRSDPRVIEAVKVAQSGEIGPLVEGRIHWSTSWGPLGGWFGKRARSGDWMVEQAVHNWDVINWATQSLPVRAVGMGRPDLFRDVPLWTDIVLNTYEKQPDRDVHDYYSGILEYENGVIVNIIHSWISPVGFSAESTRLLGTRGGVDLKTGAVSFRKEASRADRQVGKVEGEPDIDLLALQAFIDSVRTRKRPLATVEDGRKAALAGMLIREAVYRKTLVTVNDLRG